MSLLKINNRNRLFPFGNNRLSNFFGSNDFFDDNFFLKEDILPAMNIKELDNEFEIDFAAPGFSKENFDITIKENVLSISGENKLEEESKEDEYTRKEFSYNSFKRAIAIPESVDTNKEVKATYENGILKLHLFKKENAEQPSEKTIKVN